MSKLRVLSLIAVVLMCLFSSCGFAGTGSNTDEIVSVYCIARNDSQLSLEAEARRYDGSSEGGVIEFALESLFAGPLSQELESAFPYNVSLLDCSIADGVASIDLSGDYALMEGMSLTLSDACLVLTLTQFDEVNYVRITASGSPHPQRADMLYDGDAFILEPLGLDPRDVEFELFFAEAEMRYVESEIQNISIRDTNFAWYMVEMLIAGPKSDHLLPVIPEGTALLALDIDEGTCFVSFSEEFVKNAKDDAASARMTLLALANSLTGLDGIERVELAIDGVMLKKYFMYDISDGLVREEPAILTRQGVDINLYYLDADGGLTSVAAKISSSSQDVLLGRIKEYCSREAPNGLKKLVPEKTTVLDLSFDGSTAVLNLSDEYESMTGSYLAPFALLSILSDDSYVQSLKLYVDGAAIRNEPYKLEEYIK